MTGGVTSSVSALLASLKVSSAGTIIATKEVLPWKHLPSTSVTFSFPTPKDMGIGKVAKMIKRGR